MFVQAVDSNVGGNCAGKSEENVERIHLPERPNCAAEPQHYARGGKYEKWGSKRAKSLTPSHPECLWFMVCAGASIHPLYGRLPLLDIDRGVRSPTEDEPGDNDKIFRWKEEKIMVTRFLPNAGNPCMKKPTLETLFLEIISRAKLRFRLFTRFMQWSLGVVAPEDLDAELSPRASTIR